MARQTHSNALTEILTNGTGDALYKALDKRYRSYSRRLDLIGLGLSGLSEDVLNYRHPIESVGLSRNNLTTVPEVLRRMTGLTRLELSHNALTALPDWLSELPALGHLEIGSNNLKAFPEVLFAMPALNDVIGVPRYARGKQRGMLERFLIRTRNLTPEISAALFFGWVNETMQELPTSTLVAGLTGNHHELRVSVSAALGARSAGDPVGEGAVVHVLGTTTFKKTDLKKAVTDKGATYSPRAPQKATHLVMGRNSRPIPALDGNTYTFIPMEEANRWIGTSETKTSKKDAPTPVPQPESIAAAHAANLAALAIFDAPACAEFSINYTRANGLHPAMLTGMFFLAKAGADAKQRKKARDLLKKHASAGVQRALADRGKIELVGDKAEMRTSSVLSSLAKMAPEIDWITIARRLYPRSGHGLRYALAQATDNVRLEILREHLKGKTLDFYALYSPGYRPNYSSSFSYYSGTKIPDYLYALTEVVNLDLSWCLFNHVTRGISQLTNLRSLDLTGNMLTSLPAELALLTKLETLKIGQNAFDGLPSVLRDMPWLKVLDVEGNRNSPDGHIYTGISVPEDHPVYKGGCRVSDGLNSRQVQHNGYHT